MAFHPLTAGITEMPKIQSFGYCWRMAAASGLLAVFLLPATAFAQPAMVTIQPEKAWPVDGFSVRVLAFSPDGKTLAVACIDNSVILLSVATGERLHHLQKHENAISEISFTPDGARLLVGTSTLERLAIKAWDVKTGKETAVYALPDAGSIRAISPDGKWVVAINEYPTTVAHVWDIESGKEIATLDGGTALEHIQCATFSRDGKTIALGGARTNGRVVLFSCPTFKMQKSIEIEKFYKFSLSAKGNLIVCYGSGKLQLWDLATERQLPPRRILGAYPAVLSPDGSLLAYPSGKKGVVVWSTVASKQVAVLECVNKGVAIGTRIGAFSADGRLFALGGGGGATCVWQIPQAVRDQALNKDKE